MRCGGWGYNLRSAHLHIDDVAEHDAIVVVDQRQFDAQTDRRIRAADRHLKVEGGILVARNRAPAVAGQTVAGLQEAAGQRIWHRRRAQNGIDNGAQRVVRSVGGTEVNRSASAATLHDNARRRSAAGDAHLTRWRTTVRA